MIQGSSITFEYFLAKRTAIGYDIIRCENSIITVEEKQ